MIYQVYALVFNGILHLREALELQKLIDVAVREDGGSVDRVCDILRQLQHDVELPRMDDPPDKVDENHIEAFKRIRQRQLDYSIQPRVIEEDQFQARHIIFTGVHLPIRALNLY